MSCLGRNLLIVFFSFLTVSQSQQPSPTPRETGQNNKRKSDREQSEASNYQGSADKISAAIDKLASEVASWKEQSGGAPEKTGAPADWWSKWSTILSAIASIGIAVLAFFQWRTMRGHKEALDAMAKHMKNGLEETTKAANAARDSADAAHQSLLATQRPKVAVRFMAGDIDTGAGADFKVSMHGRFLVFNTRKSTPRLSSPKPCLQLLLTKASLGKLSTLASS
jgi:hypothetical protein